MQVEAKNIIEAALMAAGRVLNLDNLVELFDEGQRPAKAEVLEIMRELQRDYDGRGIMLMQLSDGFRFQVRADYAWWVSRLWEEKPSKYSRALLETLAIIAYRQPITRAEIEDIRGVAVSSSIIKTLIEREWVRVVGQRDVPGRPSMLGTTRDFLDYFNLTSLDALPTLMQLRDIEDIAAHLEESMQQAVQDESESPGDGVKPVLKLTVVKGRQPKTFVDNEQDTQPVSLTLVPKEMRKDDDCER